MPIGWRILKTRYANAPFDGEGARRNGGRWTSPGQPAVYVADSPALATLEVLVHLQSTSTLAHYSLVSIAFPEQSITAIDEARLPLTWRNHPAPPELQMLGDQWLESQASPVLKVPTVIVPAHFNYIVNPVHPDFKAFTIGAPQSYHFDQRLRSI